MLVRQVHRVGLPGLLRGAQAGCRQTAGDFGTQLGEALARSGGDPETAVAGFQGRDGVALVEHRDDPGPVDLEIVEHPLGNLLLLAPARMAAIDDVEDEVGVGDLPQGAAEGGDEVVRQLADEADGIGEDRLPEAVTARRPALV
jgi:hypothetical protein